MISMLITCEFHCYITVLIYIQQIAPWLLQEMKQMTITNKWDDCREAASDRQFAPADLQHIINTFRRSCRMEYSCCEHNIRCDCCCSLHAWLNIGVPPYLERCQQLTEVNWVWFLILRQSVPCNTDHFPGMSFEVYCGHERMHHIGMLSCSNKSVPKNCLSDSDATSAHKHDAWEDQHHVIKHTRVFLLCVLHPLCMPSQALLLPPPIFNVTVCLCGAFGISSIA